MVTVAANYTLEGRYRCPENAGQTIREAEDVLSRIRSARADAFKYLGYAFVFLAAAVLMSAGLLMFHVFTAQIAFEICSYLPSLALLVTSAVHHRKKTNLQRENPNVFTIASPETGILTMPSAAEMQSRKTVTVDRMPPSSDPEAIERHLQKISDKRTKDKLISRLDAAAFYHPEAFFNGTETIRATAAKKALESGLIEEGQTVFVDHSVHLSSGSDIRISTQKNHEYLETYQIMTVKKCTGGKVDSDSKLFVPDEILDTVPIATVKILLRYYPRKNKTVVVTDFESRRSGEILRELEDRTGEEVERLLETDYGRWGDSIAISDENGEHRYPTVDIDGKLLPTEDRRQSHENLVGYLDGLDNPQERFQIARAISSYSLNFDPDFNYIIHGISGNTIEERMDIFEEMRTRGYQFVPGNRMVTVYRGLDRPYVEKVEKRRIRPPGKNYYKVTEIITRIFYQESPRLHLFWRELDNEVITAE